MNNQPDQLFHNEPLPENEDEVRLRHESNRKSWNEGARHYSDTLDQAIKDLREGKSKPSPG